MVQRSIDSCHSESATPMQAVVALCHFCENHGPRVVVTCQPVRTDTISAEPLLGTSNQHLESPLYFTTFAADIQDPDERCLACSSFGEGPGLLSNDSKTSTTYISTQAALNETVYERVRNSCLRSLSCEVSAPPISPPRTGEGHEIDSLVNKMAKMRQKMSETEGVVFFGDDEHGYTLSRTFRIRDAKARGFLRLFSIIVVSNDMTLMINNYDFFLESFSPIIDHLQEAAAKTFDNEQSTPIGEDTTGIGAVVVSPAQAARAAQFPAGFLRRGVSLDTKRPLTELTGDPKVWDVLHKQMMWMLRAQALRCHDHFLEGVPTQDMLVVRELHPKHLIALDLHAPDKDATTLRQLENLKHIAAALEEKQPELLDVLLTQLLIGEQVVVLSSERATTKAFLLALSNLLPIGCLRVESWAEVYPEDCRYNLLGGPLCLDIPIDENAMVIKMESAEPASECMEMDAEEQESWNASVSVNTLLAGSTIDVIRRPNPRPKISLLKRYRDLLLDRDVRGRVLDMTLRSTREDWISKAKLLFSLHHEGCNVQKSQLLNIIKCIEADLAVLDFWQAAISNSTKQQVLDVINSHNAMRT